MQSDTPPFYVPCSKTLELTRFLCVRVSAIAWSPHQHGLLASGGGTADKCIRFWNTLTEQPMQCVDTGSQVGHGGGETWEGRGEGWEGRGTGGEGVESRGTVWLGGGGRGDR